MSSPLTTDPNVAASDDGANRPLRADAQRNRDRILAAAEATFAGEGITVPIDVVAQRAGVGIGTLYRHFPTKESLFEAIVVARLESMITVAGDYLGAESGVALFEFVRVFAREVSHKKDLFEAIAQAGVDLKDRCTDLFLTFTTTFTGLVDQAKAAGLVRRDVLASDLLDLVVGCCHAASQRDIDEESIDRLLTIVFAGVRPL